MSQAQMQNQPPSKKKIFFHSCHSRQLSGFGKNCKNILKYLCETGKYDIVEYANSYKKNDPTLKSLPWRCIGSGPSDPKEIARNNSDPDLSKKMSYGLLNIDEVIKREKPDIYIGAEDIWALMELTNKPWWNKINCMIWTTLDSLPIFPEAINLGKKIQHYYTWASFASDELINKGVTHAKHLHGAVETKNFFKLPNDKKQLLRSNHQLSDEFIVGFVFRNQLRKSVPNLLQGFKLFKQKNKFNKPPKLLLHTGWHEGWDITSLMIENGIDQNDVLTTYFCKNCKQYSIKPFTTRNEDCPFCQSKKTLSTITVKDGPTEKQLNEIYNLMDVYCHPFTSGGQEIPIQEAKLTELITLSTNYSCGTDMCKPDSGGFALDWSEFREQTTQFIKASTSPDSICRHLTKILKMDKKTKDNLGKKSRDFVIKNYSPQVVGKKLEEIISQMPKKEYDFDFPDRKLNINYKPKEELNDLDWVIDIYKNMLGVYQTQHDKDAQFWLEKLIQGTPREQLLAKFKDICSMEIKNSENRIKIKELTESNKVIGIQAIKNEYNVLLGSSLISSIKKENKYINSKIIFFCPTTYEDILNNNTDIEYIIDPDRNVLSQDSINRFQCFFDIDNIVGEKSEKLILSQVNNFS